MKTHLDNALHDDAEGHTSASRARRSTSHVRASGKVLAQFPLNNLVGVVCFGRVVCSLALLGPCVERGVAVSLLTERGRFLASIRGYTSGNVLLRRQQYRRPRPPRSCAKSRRSTRSEVWRARRRPTTSAPSTLCWASPRSSTISASRAGRAGRRWTASTPCCRSSTRSCSTTSAPPARPLAWTPASASCTPIAPASRALL